MRLARTGDHIVRRSFTMGSYADADCSCGALVAHISMRGGPTRSDHDIDREFLEAAERHLAPHRPADEAAALRAVGEASGAIDDAERARREGMDRLRAAVRDADRLDITRQAIIAQAGLARQTVYDMLR